VTPTPVQRRRWPEAVARFLRIAALGALLVNAACGAADETEPDAAEEGPLEGPLLVSAASSLTDAFREVAGAFEARHPGVSVQLNLAGSATLTAQILEGAPVDVFAPADPSHMDAVARAGGLAGPAHGFAGNRLALVVPAGNPGGVRGLEDLAREELLVGLCAQGVPCGDLAREALSRAGITPAIDTEEPRVRALLTRVELGELDVAVTYATDVLAAGDAVEGIPLPQAYDPTARYPVAALAGAPAPRVADAFVDFVRRDEAAAILRRHGFVVP
jgi:molybdate transport system substrate-binding protein